MVVKELVALLGVKTNKASVKKANSAMDSIAAGAKKAAIAFAAIFAAGKAFAAVKTFVAQASDANETLNVLDAAFQENQQTVIQWADEFGRAAGRSIFDMRQMAGELGSVLTPMMEGNADASAEMSMRLSELAVDLGSFFNAQEPDVLRALRSGITGEAEALKKFGIVMNSATLKAHALDKGLKSNIESMSQAELTALRYSFILETTSLAHGDAEKTAFGFANATKALSARLKDIGTRFGLNLIPPLEEGIQLFIGSTSALEDAAKVASTFIRTILQLVVRIAKFVKSASPMTKAILGITAALVGIVALLKLGIWGKWILVIAAIALVVEDFVAFMEGADSVFGKLLKKAYEFLGIDPDQANYEQWLQDVKFFGSSVGDVFDSIATALAGNLSEMGMMFSAWLDGDEAAMRESTARLKVLYDDALESMSRGLEKLFGIDFPRNVEQASKFWKDMWTGMKDWLYEVFIESVKTDLVNFGNWVKDWFKYLIASGKSALPGTGQATRRTPSPAVKGALVAAGAAGGGAVAGPGKGAGRPGPWIESSAAPNYGPWLPGNNTNNVNVDVRATPGMDEKKLAMEVGKQVKKEVEKGNRAAIRALSPQAAPLG